ncbi:unnamed protein product [Durusdinium trenchii]|uniref:Uncharacterized protein n=1 Tax=Durusdinium trenchii TaxID=1381693 RepID=A0ABP0K8N5_9DINO
MDTSMLLDEKLLRPSLDCTYEGSWRSAKGECAIFTDPRINRLTYEESLSDQDARLHGWLEPYEDEQGDGVIACWVAVLHLLGEDELPWYGPSFGEEPEALGQIKVELLPGQKMQTQLARISIGRGLAIADVLHSPYR